MTLYLEQGSLTEGEGSVQFTVDLLPLTSLDQLLLIMKTSLLNEEANCNEPSPSVSVPCSETSGGQDYDL